MIIEWLFEVAAGFVAWVATVFPETAVPDWFRTMDTSVNDWFAQWDGVGIWVDWRFLGGCVSAVLAWWIGGFVIKGIRALIGHAPEVGGNG